MKIIIAGGGGTGFSLAGRLVLENHNVTVIDSEEEPLLRASGTLDVMCVRGGGDSAAALREAGVKNADMVVAVTGSEEVNLICCLTAKRLGVGYAAARVRDPEIMADPAWLRKGFGVDTAFCPEYDAALKMSRLFRFPAASDVEFFSRGRAEFAALTVRDGDFFSGRSPAELFRKARAFRVLPCATERARELLFPDGSFALQPGARLYFVGDPAGIRAFFGFAGQRGKTIRSVGIVGGSRTASFLIPLLESMGITVTLAEGNGERCRALAEAFPRALIIRADGADPELLDSERLGGCDALAALTDRDGENLLLALCALRNGVSKAIAQSDRPDYTRIARPAGLESVVSPRLAAAGTVLRLVRNVQSAGESVLSALYPFADGEAEAAEFLCGGSASRPGRPSRPSKDISATAVFHDGRVLPPESVSRTVPGDSVLILARNRAVPVPDVPLGPAVAGHPSFGESVRP